MATIPGWVIEAGVRKLIDVVKGDSKEEKKPEEKKPAEEKPKQEPKKEYKKGGTVKKSRGDGCAQRGKTKGRMV
jgi:hypothetical protein